MIAYIALGSNIGDRQMYINKAINMMAPDVVGVSPIIETEPIGMGNVCKFLNAVVEIDTQLQPLDLLAFLENIEKQLGREEKGNYKSRTIDLDILFYGDLKIQTPRLTIPHPKLAEREFLWQLYRTLKEKKARVK